MINVIFLLIFCVSIFGFSKEYIDWCVVPNSMIVILFLAIISISLICKRERIFIPIWFTISFVLTVVLYVIGDGNCFSQYALLTGVLSFFLFLGGNVDNRLLDDKRLARVIPLILVIEAFCGIIQFVQIGQVVAVKGHFDNTLGFAMTLAFGIPFLLFVIKNDIKQYRVFAILALIVVLVAVSLSASRSVLLAAGGCIFLFGYRFWRNCWSKCNVGVRVFIILAAIITVFFFYWLKQDSANGRLLIWGTALNMLWDHPWGYGIGGVAREYMNHQAMFLSRVENCYWLNLTDNVNRVFNEYLAVGIEFGVWVMFLALILLGYVLKKIFTETDDKNRVCFLLLFIVLFVSLFSYPLYYPVSWVVIGYSICRLVDNKLFLLKIKSTFIVKYCTGMILLSGILYLCFVLQNQRQWSNVARACLRGETKALINDFPLLYSKMKYYPMFLYNYGAELNYAGQYEASNIILEQYLHKVADYDAWLLIADNYQRQDSCFQAIRALQRAVTMCPGRFYPLYQQMEIFKRLGDKGNAIQMANAIRMKKVKVPSSNIERMREEALVVLKEFEN
ncbi:MULTISPECIES: O-antigen ligase family protein [Butyricimonas]|uniref:O-antigen ligase family protein n=1 Tax=Butyricimonas TaxID=574697 RepID=UPI001D065108|nr:MULTISPECIES: O-antigen ligase family protein [Butyricimonas]MCB6972996.1 O-antigen ligase family protein [Butyricimonas synergistica]MCG4518532.1 O-antigen ligase family protein [Butyricimonas sp. DFI.6.44]